LKNKLLVSIMFLSTIIILLFMYSNPLDIAPKIYFTETMSLKQLAIANNLPVKEIQHIVSHDDITVWNINKNTPLKELSIDTILFKEAIEHVKGENNQLKDIAKFILWAVWLSFILLSVLQNKTWRTKRSYLLLIVLLVFGVFLGATPNAMESIVKFFKYTNGMEGELKVVSLALVLFSLFSVLGSKLFCSWGCQLGALQESIFNIPLLKSKYKLKVPFLLSLFIRFVLFTLFICLLYGWVFGIKNFVIFHNINLFKIFDLDLPVIAIFLLPILFILFFFTYRPFCSFICPFSLYAWLLENLALNKIKINKQICISCQQCVQACPTEAMQSILNDQRKYFLPDCWSCGKCINACPVKAITYE